MEARGKEHQTERIAVGGAVRQEKGKLGEQGDEIGVVLCEGAEDVREARRRAGSKGRLGAVLLDEVVGVVPAIAWIPQSAHFVELMSGRTTDGTVGAGPERAVNELGVAVAGFWGAVGQVFGHDFPAVVVSGDQVGIRTVEERNVGLIPIPVTIVPKCLALQHGTEGDDVSGTQGGGKEKQGQEFHG